MKRPFQENFSGDLKYILDAAIKAAGWVQAVISFVLLTILYLMVLTPIALLLRLRGKDFMERTWDDRRPSYWSPVEASSDVKQRYLNQF